MKPFLIVLPVFLLLTVPHAQQGKGRVGFVSVKQLVSAMPGNASYLSISKKADADLLNQSKNLQSLIAKATSSPTATNKAAVTKAQQTFATAQKNYRTQLDNASKPLKTKLDAAIAKVARANGYSVVLDSTVAAQSKLVIYGSTANDLTAAVTKELKK